MLLVLVMRPTAREGLLGSACMFMAGTGVMIVLGLAWNYSVTHHPLRFTHNAMQPLDTLGFGKRSEGYAPDVEASHQFTPREATVRIGRHVLPAIGHHILGWGYYDPSIIRSISVRRSRYPSVGRVLGIVGLALPLVIITIPLLDRSRNRYDLLFLGFLVASLASYFCFYFEASTWGSSPTNSRYYNESIVLGLVPLLARGMNIIVSKVKAVGLRAVIAVVAVVLASNTVYSYVRFGSDFRSGWFAEYRDLPRQVREQRIHRAVVFVEGIHAPLGEYPFRSLRDADVVYFRLGPSRQWGLNPTTWRTAYDRYFAGRKPYLYRKGRLQALGSPW
jgi:hypothetical protein